MNKKLKKLKTEHLHVGRVLLGSIVLGWLGFSCSIGQKLFFVGLVD